MLSLEILDREPARVLAFADKVIQRAWLDHFTFARQTAQGGLDFEIMQHHRDD